MELWDAYDAAGRPTGETLVRGLPVPPGRYHLVAEVLIRHRDGSWLLMRRDEGKPFCPGVWEASAGGSALRGESAEDAARREAWEETGLRVSGLRRMERIVGDCFLFDYFVGQTEDDKQAVTLQPGETADFRWVDTGALRRAAAAQELMHAGWLLHWLDRL